MSISIIEAKSAINRQRLPDTFLVSLYRCLAPYRGCGHGCIYCDGRAEKYYVEGDFEKDIAVRSNLPQLLERQSEQGFTSREYGALCIGSGVTDIYQPLEAIGRITRRMLEILAKTGLPLVILTKSSLILRDFDLLKLFPRVLIILTITTLDQETAGMLEPGASPANERLEIISRAKQEGFLTGVMAMPLCPRLTDQPEQVKSLFYALKNAGADFIFPGGLTLRPGRQKALFMELLRKYGKKGLIELYEDVYRQDKQSGMPLKSYTEPLIRQYSNMLNEMQMPSMIPHAVYSRILSLPDSLHVLLSHMQTLYFARQIDINPLKSSAFNYASWLKANRTSLRRRRKRTQKPFDITEKLSEMLKDCDIKKITGNRKLADFMGEIIHNNSIFDYTGLKLR